MANTKIPMTPAQRLKAAFEHRIPDEVPMFELEFYLAQEFFGREIITFCHDEKAFQLMSRLEQEKYIDDAADFYVKVYGTLDYAVFPVHTSWDIDSWEYRFFIKCIRDRIKDTRMLSLWWYGDGTFAIPDGDHMYDFAYRMYDDPEGMKAEAEQICVKAIEFNHRKKEAGIDVLMLTSDYCYNSGPFMSPDMFAEYVTPYLARIIEAGRADGMWCVKHTDGNIMPIIDQLVECRPHAIHSLDPMAGVDIAEVKRLYGSTVALCGNVNCALLQTGTEEEIRESAMYALKSGKPGGGYVYCTSNVPFKGMPPEKYQLVLDIWKENKAY